MGLLDNAVKQGYGFNLGDKSPSTAHFGSLTKSDIDKALSQISELNETPVFPTIKEAFANNIWGTSAKDRDILCHINFDEKSPDGKGLFTRLYDDGCIEFNEVDMDGQKKYLPLCCFKNDGGKNVVVPVFENSYEGISVRLRNTRSAQNLAESVSSRYPDVMFRVLCREAVHSTGKALPSYVKDGVQCNKRGIPLTKVVPYIPVSFIKDTNQAGVKRVNFVVDEPTIKSPTGKGYMTIHSIPVFEQDLSDVYQTNPNYKYPENRPKYRDLDMSGGSIEGYCKTFEKGVDPKTVKGCKRDYSAQDMQILLEDSRKRADKKLRKDYAKKEDYKRRQRVLPSTPQESQDDGLEDNQELQ